MPDGTCAYPAYFQNELIFHNKSSCLYIDILNSAVEWFIFSLLLTPSLLQTNRKNPHILFSQQNGLLKWQFLLISGSKTMVAYL